MEKAYRKLTEEEKKIIEKLLERDFPGREEIRKQVFSALVRTISEYNDNFGSLEFKVASGNEAKVTSRIPVSGVVNDIDGIPVEVYLHVIDGKIDELEIVKVDNSDLKGQLDPSQMKIITDQEVTHE